MDVARQGPTGPRSSLPLPGDRRGCKTKCGAHWPKRPAAATWRLARMLGVVRGTHWSEKPLALRGGERG